MRLDIRYRMLFHYDEPVWEAQNEIRVRPRDGGNQRVIAYRLTPTPTARVLSFVDYWGTTVDHVGVRDAHHTFELIAEAAVDTTGHVDEVEDASVSGLADESFQRDMSEYLMESNHVAWTAEIEDLARPLVDTDTVFERAQRCVDIVHDVLDYERGSTDIGVSLPDLVSEGKGVCQDFAHLTLGLLRCSDVPARYVSGYLFAADESYIGPEPDLGEELDKPVRVQTHAWVEVAVPGSSWLAIDPTNRRPVGSRHVIIGHGRDYDDIAPVRGVFKGPGRPTVEAEVEIRHMDATRRTTGFDQSGRLSAFELAELRRRRQQQQQQQQQ